MKQKLASKITSVIMQSPATSGYLLEHGVLNAGFNHTVRAFAEGYAEHILAELGKFATGYNKKISFDLDGLAVGVEGGGIQASLMGVVYSLVYGCTTSDRFHPGFLDIVQRADGTLRRGSSDEIAASLKASVREALVNHGELTMTFIGPLFLGQMFPKEDSEQMAARLCRLLSDDEHQAEHFSIGRGGPADQPPVQPSQSGQSDIQPDSSHPGN